METSVGAKPSSPPTRTMKVPHSNLSGELKDKRQPAKPAVGVPAQRAAKKIPTVLSTGNIKSPLHHKYALDSSNEFSGDLGHKKVDKPKN